MDIEKIRQIDFGEIDGYGDPNLEKYFLDNGYWSKVIDIIRQLLAYLKRYITTINRFVQKRCGMLKLSYISDLIL